MITKSWDVTQPSHENNVRHACARASTPESKAHPSSGIPTQPTIPSPISPSSGTPSWNSLPVARSLRNSQATFIASNNDILSHLDTTLDVSMGVSIPFCNQQIAADAFRKGFLPDGELYKDLTKFNCSTMEDAFAAWIEIRWEEDELYRTPRAPSGDSRSEEKRPK